MKCPNCGNSLFDGQFRCERCGQIVAISLAKKEADIQSKAEKKSPKKETKKEN